MVYVGLLHLAWLPGDAAPHVDTKDRHRRSNPIRVRVVASIGGGWIADGLMRRSLSPVNSRTVPLSPALLVSAAIGLVSALMYMVVIRGEPITTAELDMVAGVHTIGPTS